MKLGYDNYHCNHFSFYHGGHHLCYQVPPPLGILLKGLVLPLAYILQLDFVMSHVGIVLVLPSEGNNQVLP